MLFPWTTATLVAMKLRNAWHIIYLVFHRYYPPRLLIFFPLYKIFRCRLRIPMALSNLLVWTTSAMLHGGILACSGCAYAALGFAAIFLCLGIISTFVILCAKPSCHGVLRRIQRT
jgi:hypothetical protein